MCQVSGSDPSSDDPGSVVGTGVRFLEAVLMLLPIARPLWILTVFLFDALTLIESRPVYLNASRLMKFSH